jgi:hypothetical protein
MNQADMSKLGVTKMRVRACAATNMRGIFLARKKLKCASKFSGILRATTTGRLG